LRLTRPASCIFARNLKPRPKTMPYCTQAEIETQVPASQVAKVLGSEGAALLDAIIAGADLEVDARLAPATTVPFTTPLPPIVRRASLLFACETLWRRIGVAGEANNPFAAAANAMRDLLDEIAAGERLLGPGAINAFGDEALIFNKARGATTTEYNMGEEA